ncbi:hypothetical protein DPMN_068419 [Dreissena polymorpha]|uniref:Uncharacterized protein n=1 Tax=Dreissena polymorpha TaxID=45954 RepID=A0A9D3YX47_DREPO|nr:hypothetical protein DPMN_068419 [Dreissena polymorpha]
MDSMSVTLDLVDLEGKHMPPKTSNEKVDFLKSSQRKGSVNKVAWTCMDCDQSFIKDGDMLLLCQYCEKPKCITCLGLSKAFYKQVSGRANFPWFCDICVGKAIGSVKTSKSFEDQCHDFLSKFQEKVETRLVDIENDVKEVKQELAGLKQVKDGTDRKGEAVASENIVKQATTEIQSRFDRRNNIAFYGIKEIKSNLKEECEKLDNDCIHDIITEKGIHVHSEEIKNLKRFGKKGLTRVIENKDGNKEEVEVPRVIIGTFTEEAKIRIMKNAHKLSSSKSDHFRTIGIKHDMT